MKSQKGGRMRFSSDMPGAGFTLVEIMIVVAIIGILVALGMPNFFRIRMDSNEGTVRGDLRAFSTANESYRAVQNPPVYAPDVATLLTQNYIDSTWLNPGNRHGFIFAYAIGADGLTYALEANPLEPGVTGINTYCVDHTGVIMRAAAAGLGTAGGCVGGTPLGA